jgi:Mn-dependent DtxR family transcriptional regulator
MFIELFVAFDATVFPLDQTPRELDANLTLVAVTVMLGHAEGRAVTVSQIAAYLRMPPSSVKRRLDVLIDHGLIQCIERKYYLEPGRAKNVPHRDRFELILSQGFAILGPYLNRTSPNR